MKNVFLFLLLSVNAVYAHDHVEVGVDPLNRSRLALSGPGIQLALYVPLREFFSSYTPNFPGGCFATELTFTTQTGALDSAQGADLEIELVSVTGPVGGVFSFWEVDAVSPSWSRSLGWLQTPADKPSFAVVVGGEGHVHGRLFSVNLPGDYTVVFRARDKKNVFQPSMNYTVRFRALTPPLLSISPSNSQVVLSYVGRPGLVYDMQSITNLSATNWQTFVTQDGSGGTNFVTRPFSVPQAFFRIVEYK